MGDPAGIGPEVIAGAWADPQFHQQCRAVVVGQPAIMQRAVELLGLQVELATVQDAKDGVSSSSRMPCLASGSDDALMVAPGQIDPRGGQAAYDALILAASLAIDRQVDGIVTAPLHKAALSLAGHHYPGHTELLAELCGVHQFAMMLYLGPSPELGGPAGLGVIHVTLHVALRDALAHLNQGAIIEKIQLAHDNLKAIKGAPPSIGVCALNPHGGEEGLFGDEERKMIQPAVERSRSLGIDAHGPIPTDTLMVRARDGEFDGVVAMYHDQGHIALKLLGMHRAVNVTLGLPIVRTSVAHGTAFDLAWQGRAKSSSMIEAVRVASKLAMQRRST